MKKSLLALLFTISAILLFAQDTKDTPDDYWVMLKARAARLYDFDLTLDFDIGLDYDGRKRLDSLDTRYTSTLKPYAELSLELPLTLSPTRHNDLRRKYLQKGAEIIKRIEENTAKCRIQQQKIQSLKTIYQAEKNSEINTYYSAIGKLEEYKAELNQALREFEALVR